jgi:hypothetical protein
MADSRAGNGVCTGRKIMEDTNNDYINVDKKYLSELEKKANEVEWLRGYMQGMEDCVDYFIRIVQAARQEL